MRMTKSFVVNQGPAILVAIVLFILSSIPYPPPVILNLSHEDLIMHATVYGVFGFFMARAFYYQTGYLRLKQNLLLFTFLVGTIYGISDEIHQYFVPGRVSDILDVLADSVGTLIGFVVFRLIKKK
jgi:VanZ family protein